ncbi:MAG: hypothetical protein LN545_03475 [Candidatus Megaira endosymbiont of Carteria cerasiformis]|nr:hypothetical protein [Candidatus Megaera polyxenophila]MCC8461035.1 hypothetical protein [Candidatus Megaera polyxenophila]
MKRISSRYNTNGFTSNRVAVVILISLKTPCPYFQQSALRFFNIRIKSKPLILAFLLFHPECQKQNAFYTPKTSYKVKQTKAGKASFIKAIKRSYMYKMVE